MLKLKSHTEKEILKAVQKGKRIFALDTGTDGEDDTLIGTYEKCLADTLHHFEIDRLPEHWELTEITKTIYPV